MIDDVIKAIASSETLQKAAKAKKAPRITDFSKLKYVLYARKSSEEESAQEKSLPNQIEDCKRFAEANGLNVVDIITEQKSAKIYADAKRHSKRQI